MTTSKRLIVIAALLILLGGFAKIWPIPLDPNPAMSLKLYAHYLAGERIAVADVLDSVELACAIGPYSNFQDASVAPLLTAPQQAAAAATLNKHNLHSHGDNRIFIVGFKGEKVTAVFTSSFFASLPGQDKLGTAPRCIDGSGFISIHKFMDVVVIKLQRGI